MTAENEYLAAVLEIDKVMRSHKERLFLAMQKWVKTRTPNELIAHIEAGLESQAPAPLPTLELTMRVLLAYLDGGPDNAPYDEYRALEAAIAEWQGRPPAPASPDLLEAARYALSELQEMNKGIGWKDGEWESVRLLRAALDATPRPPEAAPAPTGGHARTVRLLAAQKVACPVCKVKPGELCYAVGQENTPGEWAHSPRIELALGAESPARKEADRG